MADRAFIFTHREIALILSAFGNTVNPDKLTDYELKSLAYKCIALSREQAFMLKIIRD